jgi:hypothetical protein
LIGRQFDYRLHQIDALRVLADAQNEAGDHAAAADARNLAAELTRPVPSSMEPVLRRLVTELEQSEED